MGKMIQEQTKLFEQWEKCRPQFVRDGIVDEKKYQNSKPRLLFVLKEVNDEGGGGWNLCELLVTANRAQTWNNLARWIKGIKNLPEPMDWKDLEIITQEIRADALSYGAFMNIKKSPGGHTADGNEVERIGLEDAEFIKEQISIYDPNLIICCGSAVGSTLEKIYDIKQSAWKITRRGVWYSKLGSGAWLIWYSHPEARVQSNLLHYGLVDAVSEILQRA